MKKECRYARYLVCIMIGASEASPVCLYVMDELGLGLGLGFFV